MADAAAGAPAAVAAGEEIKPYSIHVPPKYLELTKQKLELTRLPHEGSEPKSEDWWEPKPQVEPLIDFWLEKYSWRDQEKSLNETLKQFRTTVTISTSETPLRLHFIHIRSVHANAVPLLLIPPFPFTNLSFGHLVKPFTDPEDAATNQAFHLVIPSLPGLGFSDALPNNTPVISTVADVLDTLMQRLNYRYYLVTNAGAASLSPAEIDWKLANYLATYYASSCLGTHLISPPLTSPKLSEAPLEWAKWSIASFFHASILGYSADDFSALKRAQIPIPAPGFSSTAPPPPPPRRRLRPSPSKFGLNKLGLREPNTLAYALCDSPTGLLVFVIKALHMLGPRVSFTPEQVITFAELAWLPGPEYAMRFWAHCAAHDEEAERKRREAGITATTAGSAPKPRVAITVFLGPKKESGTDAQPAGASAAEGNGASEMQQGRQVELPLPLPYEDGERYACPAWGRSHYDVVFAQRQPGTPGLLSWERPEIILGGVRGLAKEILRLDKRLTPSAEPATAPLEQVVVATERDGPSTPPTASLPAAQEQQLQVPPRQVVLPKIPEESPGFDPEGSTPNLQLGEQELTKGKELGKLTESEENVAGDEATKGKELEQLKELEKLPESEETVAVDQSADGVEKEAEVGEKEAKALDDSGVPSEVAKGKEPELAPQDLVEEKGGMSSGGEVLSDEESPDTLVVATPPLEVK